MNKFGILIGAVSLGCLKQAQAINASPEPFMINGVKAYIYGDEHNNWEEDEHGYAFTYNEAKEPVYLTDDETGEVHASNIVVAPNAQQQLEALHVSQHLQMPTAEGHGRRLLAKEMDADMIPALEHHKRLLAVDERPNLVILVRFSDHVNRQLPSREDINFLFNQQNAAGSTIAPSGSVRDYYEDQSYGKVSIKSTVTNWITVDYTEAQAAGGCSALCGGARFRASLRNALDKAVAQGIDLRDFDADNDKTIDMISFITSSQAAEAGGTDRYGTPKDDRIWSHKWNLDQTVRKNGVRVSRYYCAPAQWRSTLDIGRIGVIVHELGHFFGLPDLYDTNNAVQALGLGNWSCMANSWGWRNSQYYPPSMDAWCKMKLGFATPTVIGKNGLPHLQKTTYAIKELQTSPDIIKIDHGYGNNEYLMIENRQAKGYDREAQTSGILVFHVDEGKSTNGVEGYPGSSGYPSNHYKVQLIEADNRWDLPRNNRGGYRGDPFRVGGKTLLSHNTSPELNSYFFRNECGQRSSGVTIRVTSSSGPTMNVDVTLDHTHDCDQVVVETKSPTRSPIRQPTKSPIRQPTRSPIPQPTKSPIPQPTRSPIPQPTKSPIPAPTQNPTSSPIPGVPIITENPTSSPVNSTTLDGDEADQVLGGDGTISSESVIALGVVGSGAVLLVAGASVVFLRRRRQRQTDYASYNAKDAQIDNPKFDKYDL